VGERREILTIGHSTHPEERFVSLLRGARVEAVADVRRYPASRRSPQFGAESLAATLSESGIAYEGLGAELGGRRRARADSPNTGWRVPAFRAYADHLGTAAFAAGLRRLEELARRRRAAIMCAEGDWRRCHRRLIADALTARGWRVLHVGSDGRLEEHAVTPFAVVTEGRLLYPAQPSLEP
jgi:uncharacterized protein (DUF488 family)